MRFGIFIYDGVEPIDLATFGVLSMARRIAPQIEICTIAPKAGIVRLSNGLDVVAQFGIEDAPACDIVIVTGGPGWEDQSRSPATLAYIRRVHASGKVASVCTGAMILAASGVLDDAAATTKRSVVASRNFATRAHARHVSADRCSRSADRRYRHCCDRRRRLALYRYHTSYPGRACSANTSPARPRAFWSISVPGKPTGTPKHSLRDEPNQPLNRRHHEYQISSSARTKPHRRRVPTRRQRTPNNSCSRPGNCRSIRFPEIFLTASSNRRGSRSRICRPCWKPAARLSQAS